jgi:fluoroacetyl-CoA thioesterase
MSTAIISGVTHTLPLDVHDQMLATVFTPHLSDVTGLSPVFATAFMVGLMEWACIEALKPYLPDGQNTVGTHVTLNHIAPTPVGMAKGIKVTAQVELVEVKGRTLRFRVNCYDECGLIGSGFHERSVIDTCTIQAAVRRLRSLPRLITRSASV